MAGTPIFDQLVYIVGEITLILIIGFILLSIVVVALSFYSIRRGYFYLPRLVKSGIVATEGMAKGICKLLGLDDKEMTAFAIRLHNAMNQSDFEKVPADKRAIFIPQCLRNADCPAHLTPEGIICRRCGRCEIGSHVDSLEALGYHVWIAPGSTLIKRMVKQYRPQAVIGVGCMIEVREGLELLDKANIIGMGVVTLKDGCVETMMNWQDLMDTALLGLEPALNAENS
ncbi:DUF116 domain-containing protein [Methanomicrobium mobile]|uniref:DUF116 domain-containing protein n=1 Tax=Methanomicrobium mobile TaxID=2205 RepID=UPI0005B2DAAF|nr:DUF116 domain-containing protein [Methanomicrobium mobile]